MKKIFTLVAAAMMAVGVNAQKEWNFSTWTAKELVATEVVDELTVAATSTAKVVIDGNNKTVDDVKYTQRLKTGGGITLNTETNAPEGRYLAFNVPGNCTIKVLACSSNSTDVRTLNCASSTYDAIFNTVSIPAGTPVWSSVDYVGAATTIYLYSATGGINFYAISFTPKSTGISNIAAEETNANAPIYNLAGQQVSKDFKGVCIQNGKKFINK